jgi:hypothetical protein
MAMEKRKSLLVCSEMHQLNTAIRGNLYDGTTELFEMLD